MVLSYTWSVITAQILVTTFAQPRALYVYIHPDYDFSLLFHISDVVSFSFFTRSAADGGFAYYSDHEAQLTQQGPNVYTFDSSTVNKWYNGIHDPGFWYNASIRNGDLTTLTFTSGASLRVTFEGREYDLVNRGISLQAGRFAYQGERSSGVSMVFEVQEESSSATLELSCGRVAVPPASFNLVEKNVLWVRSYALTPRNRAASSFTRLVRRRCPQLGGNLGDVVFTSESSLYLPLGGGHFELTAR
ncbi:hypothetical protein FOL47_004732 [Perkinsus chesapeaki]|uniref:Uncharacterized protein n=1 Tax=Perkinsus chesapeaki TaxID=330153 RepID=A0A7J6M0V7_PERCH|nr:hypothetical protein FOL47_004732 [Perkinsus chesapeaki]